MSTDQKRPFPRYRPEIRIEASGEEPFRIDFKERQPLGKRDAPPHNWGEAMTWEEDLPANDRFVIDGGTCVHYYDKLTDAACGIAG